MTTPWSTVPAPRTYAVGDLDTAAFLNAMRDQLNALNDRVQVVRKPSDTSIISSTTLANDPHLFFTAVAGQTYAFDFTLIFNSSSGSIDAKVGFAFPSGTLSFAPITMDPAAGATSLGQGSWGASSSATSGVTYQPIGVAPVDTTARVSGSFLCVTGGTVTLMWAQNTSTATNMTLKAGSCLTAIRAAA